MSSGSETLNAKVSHKTQKTKFPGTKKHPESVTSENLYLTLILSARQKPGRRSSGGADHLILAAGNDSQFVKFCAVAHMPELGVNPLFAKNRDQVTNRAQLAPMLETVMLMRTKADWLAALEAAKVPCGAINNLAEVFADPQVAARGMVTPWLHPLQSDLRLVASPMKLSATPPRNDRAPPMLGQHTDEVLRELLQMTGERLTGLKNAKVV